MNALLHSLYRCFRASAQGHADVLCALYSGWLCVPTALIILLTSAQVHPQKSTHLRLSDVSVRIPVPESFELLDKKQWKSTDIFKDTVPTGFHLLLAYKGDADPEICPETCAQIISTPAIVAYQTSTRLYQSVRGRLEGMYGKTEEAELDALNSLVGLPYAEMVEHLQLKKHEDFWTSGHLSRSLRHSTYIKLTKHSCVCHGDRLLVGVSGLLLAKSKVIIAEVYQPLSESWNLEQLVRVGEEWIKQITSKNR
jgi:hypothetical protein